MRTLILGHEPMAYVDQPKEGLLLYYAAPNDRTLGLRASNRYIDKRSDASLYDLIMSVDLSRPVWADVTFVARAGYIGLQIEDIVFEEAGKKAEVEERK